MPEPKRPPSKSFSATHTATKMQCALYIRVLSGKVLTPGLIRKSFFQVQIGNMKFARLYVKQM